MPDLNVPYAQLTSIEPWLKIDDPAADARAPAVAGGARQARRPVGVHPVLLLLDLVPQLLVERRPLSRPGHPAAGLSLDRRQPRRGDGRAPGQSRGSVPALSLPHHHELHQDLPEGLEPGEGDRRDQEADGRAHDLSGSSSAMLKPPGTDWGLQQSSFKSITAAAALDPARRHSSRDRLRPARPSTRSRPRASSSAR